MESACLAAHSRVTRDDTAQLTAGKQAWSEIEAVAALLCLDQVINKLWSIKCIVKSRRYSIKLLALICANCVSERLKAAVSP